MEKLKKYWGTLYELRFFIWHMVKIDLKNKFRRSKLGILWTFVSPLCLSAIMGTVFAVAFHYEILDYMPYVLSGILFWDLVMSSFSAGGYSIISHDSYIRQCSHPITMYTLKNSLVYIITFLIACLSLVLWVILRHPVNVLIWLLAMPGTLIIYFLLAWGGTTIAGYTCVQYRDYPMMAPLILQVVWYLSPIFFQKSLFETNELLYAWFKINPVTHMLELLRSPLLEGRMPSLSNYLVSFAFALVIDLLAVRINRKKERNVIFYL